jgi:hypothetical protein
VGNKCVPRFPEGHTTPFDDGRAVELVTFDKAGHEAFVTRTSYGIEVIIDQSTPVASETSIALKSIDLDTAKFIISSPTTTASAEWRLDGGNWNEARLEESNSAFGLLPGKHQIEARTLSPMLIYDQTPAKLNIDVSYDDEALIKSVASKLFDSDFTVREQTIRRLASFGARAIPVIESLRKDRSAEEQWWIDAAISRVARY